jgi:hypothetical protein
MSDETTTPPVEETAPTEPLPSASAEKPAEPAVTVADTAAATEQPQVDRRLLPSARIYVFAVAAAVVLALGLSAFSFGTGFFVGRMTGGPRGVMASVPGGMPQMPSGGDTDVQQGMPPGGQRGGRGGSFGHGRSGGRVLPDSQGGQSTTPQQQMPLQQQQMPQQQSPPSAQ